MGTRSMLILLAMAALPAMSQTTAIYPTGQFPDDFNHLKAAITAAPAGAELVLKATNAAGQFTAFNLGDGVWPQGTPMPSPPVRGSLWLTKDIVVRGELLPKRATQPFAFTGVGGAGAILSDRSVVYGGFMLLYTMAPNVTVENLRLDGAETLAICLITGKRVTIRNNVITNVRRRQPAPTPAIPISPLLWGAAIYNISPQSAPGRPDFSEAIVIENNEIAMPVSDGEFEYAQTNGKYLTAQAMKIHQSQAEVRITGNVMRGDFELEALYIEGQTGHVFIADNHIEVTHERPTAYANQEPFDGILIADYTVTRPPGMYEIADNTIICDGPDADGILTQMPARTLPIGLNIMRNRITMRGSVTGGAISVAGMPKQATIAQNRLDGSGLWAIGLLEYGQLAPVAPTYAAMQANNIARFSAALADIVFRAGADYNVLVGNGGAVLDEPPNAHNIVTGFTKKSVGQAVSAALQQIIQAKLALADALRELD